MSIHGPKPRGQRGPARPPPLAGFIKTGEMRVGWSCATDLEPRTAWPRTSSSSPRGESWTLPKRRPKIMLHRIRPDRAAAGRSGHALSLVAAESMELLPGTRSKSVNLGKSLAAAREVPGFETSPTITQRPPSISAVSRRAGSREGEAPVFVARRQIQHGSEGAPGGSDVPLRLRSASGLPLPPPCYPHTGRRPYWPFLQGNTAGVALAAAGQGAEAGTQRPMGHVPRKLRIQASVLPHGPSLICQWIGELLNPCAPA